MTVALSTTIHEAIMTTCTQADRANQQAIVLDDEHITYAQLLQRAQALATHLRTTHHVKIGDIIAQCVERSIDMAVGMLAILLAGAIYCPLNPANPLDRLLTLVQETRARIVLTHTQTASRFSTTTAGLIMVNIQSEFDASSDHCRLPPVHVDPHSVAYLIHTSGSSGKPKSVQLTHDNFLNSLYGYRTTGMYCLQQDRVLQMSASSFDIHVMECLAPLVNGSTCVMLKPDGHLDLAYVVSTIHRHRVTVAFFVPSFLYSLYDHLEQTKQFQLLTSMRQIVFGGEASHPARLAPLFAALSQPSLSIQLVNGYGPAETTVFATHHRVTQDDFDRNLIPIGVPLPNYTCHILDEHLTPVPVNTVGELYIGGRGVFAGYFGDKETIGAWNDKVFVRLPFEETPCYRTGDLCRLAENGEIIFCCRANHQVKLRGQRIEIGEIEACVMRVEGVANCVVVKRTDTRTQQDFLVAFVQSRTPNGTDDLRKSILLQCRAQLPDYMVPSVVSVMDKLPLNLNGKVDRKQLLDIVELPDSSIEHISPRTEFETYVHSCWCHLLRRSEISILADFFAIGGDSLFCMKLVSAYRTKFGLARLTIRDLFNASTIEEQAKLVQISQDASLIRSAALDRTELLFRNNDHKAISVYSIPIAMHIEGGHFDAHRLRKALHQLIERHEILRTTYTLDEKSGTIQQNVQSIDNYQQVEWRINQSAIIG